MGIGIKELVIILIIVLLLFGTKRLKSLGTDLGSAIKGFRKSVQDDDGTSEPTTPPTSELPPQEKKVAEGQPSDVHRHS